MDEKLLEQVKQAGSAEELLAIAKENGVELSAEEAQAYFSYLHKSGELADEELDSVAGGGCKSSSGRTVVSSGCDCFTGCYKPIYRDGDGWRDAKDFVRDDNRSKRMLWYLNSVDGTCGCCRYLEFEGGTGVCGKS